MTETNDTSFPNILPNLLTDNEIIEHLNKHFPSIKNVHSLDREKLVSLYTQMLLPLPQRDYRPNRRGRLLNEKRLRNGLSTSASVEFSTPDAFQESPKDRTGVKRNATGDRLKPPPDCSYKAKPPLSSGNSESNEHSDNSRQSHITSPPSRCTEKAEKSKIVLKRSTSKEGASEISTETKPKRVKITWP